MKTINYVTLNNGRCGLTTDTTRAVLRSEGTSNVKSIRPATQQDVDWVRGMGGSVPQGRIAIAHAKATGAAS